MKGVVKEGKKTRKKRLSLELFCLRVLEFFVLIVAIIIVVFVLLLYTALIYRIYTIM